MAFNIGTDPIVALELHEAMKAFTKQFKAANKGVAADIAEIAKKMNKSAKAFDDYINAQKKVEEFTKKHGKYSQKTIQMQEEINQILADQSAAYQTLETDTTNLGKQYKKIVDQLNAGEIKEEEANKRLERLNKEAAVQVKTFKQVFSELKDTIRTKASDFFQALPKRLIQAGLAGLTAAGYHAVDQFRDIMRTGADAQINNLTEFYQNAAKAGVDPKELIALGAATRQVQTAMGGAAAWSGKLSAAQKTLFDHIGSTSDALKFQTQMLQTMGESGIRPTTKMYEDAQGHLVGVGKEIAKTSRLSGASFNESAQLLGDFASDQNVRFRLTAAANVRERQSILRNIQARHNEFLAMGMTTEQATRAGKALEELSGEKAQTRWEKAAKIQAVAGAIGMGAQGEKLAEAVRQGAPTAEIAKLAGPMQKALQEMKAKRGAAEFTADTLIGQAPEFFGSGSPFNTTLASGLKDVNNASGQIKTAVDAQSLVIKGLWLWDKVQNAIMKNPLWELISGSLSTLIGTVGSIYIALGAGKWLEKLGVNLFPKKIFTQIDELVSGNRKANLLLKVLPKSIGAVMAVAGAAEAGWQAGKWVYENVIAGTKFGDMLGKFEHKTVDLIKDVLGITPPPKSNTVTTPTGQIVRTPTAAVTAPETVVTPTPITTANERKTKEEEQKAKEQHQHSMEMNSHIKNVGSNTATTNDHLVKMTKILATTNEFTKDQLDMLKKATKQNYPDVYQDSPPIFGLPGE